MTGNTDWCIQRDERTGSLAIEYIHLKVHLSAYKDQHFRLCFLMDLCYV